MSQWNEVEGWGVRSSNSGDRSILLFFHTTALKSGVFYTHSTSQFRPALLQVLNSRTWLVVTVLDHTGLKNEETIQRNSTRAPRGPRQPVQG